MGATAGSWTGLSEDDDPAYAARTEQSWEPTHETVAPLSVLDVAAWLLERHGKMDTYKLQKLCYYAQAEHAAKFRTRLFVDRIEGWANGPVIPRLYKQHVGRKYVDRISEGNARAVERNGAAHQTLNETLDRYGTFDGRQLSEMTHRESPWLASREGLKAHERGDEEIPVERLRDYYSSFPDIEDVDVPPENFGRDWT